MQAALGASAVSAANVELSFEDGQQPLAPVTASLELAEPVPADHVVMVLSDTASSDDVRAAAAGDAAAISGAKAIVATLSEDRRTATVTLDHLSLKEWFVVGLDSVTRVVGEALSARFPAPECETSSVPSWVDDIIYLDDVNAPMQVCATTDPADDELAVVKIANNRPGTLVIKASQRPTWAWSSFLLGSSVTDWPAELIAAAAEGLGVPAAERDRAWILPPGHQVHIGVSKSQAGGAPTISGSMTPVSAAAGLLTQLVLGTASDDAALTAWELGVLAVCAQDVAASAGADAAALATALGKLVSCVSGNAHQIIETLIDVLPERVWKSVGSRATSLATSAKKLNVFLVAAQASYVLTDLTTTLVAESGAWAITIFVVTPRRAPGGVVLGLGGALDDLGLYAPADAAITHLTSRLGPPSRTFPAMCEMGAPAGRRVTWGALTVIIQDEPSTSVPDLGDLAGPAVVGWEYLLVNDPSDRLELRTEDGIGLGSDSSSVLASHPDAAVLDDEVGVGTYFDVFYGDLSNITFYVVDDAVVGMLSGSGCGE